jgi:anti-sigma B factor antagonist
MANEFSIDRASRDGISILRVSGRLDAKNAQQLMSACHEARSGGSRRVIVNLADITFVASSGIGTLLALTEEFREAGGSIHLVSLSDAVTSVVELLNLSQFLNIGSSEQGALETIGG